MSANGLGKITLYLWIAKLELNLADTSSAKENSIYHRNSTPPLIVVIDDHGLSLNPISHSFIAVHGHNTVF